MADLRSARRLFFVTGAGLSAESGLPTYRGVGGLYDGGVTEEGMAIEDVLSCHTFARRPELTWKYIAQIERTCRGARHNEAHRIIAELERRFERVTVLTQNVDGFHISAGSTNVIVLDLYRQAFERYNFGYAAAEATVLFVLILGVTVLQYVYSKRFEVSY